MVAWQRTFHEGIAPSLSTPGLEALRTALATDDPELIQGATTQPPPLPYISGWPVEGACGVTYPAWKGDGLETIAEVEEVFAQTCLECDQRLDEPAAVRFFLNWFDETPRQEMRRLFLPEVETVLEQRRQERNESHEPDSR